MTINIAVKCPQGIALGTDSLVTLLTKDGLATAFSPFYRKLFRLGSLPVGIMLNGDIATGRGHTFEDVISEFAETSAAAGAYDLSELTLKLRDFIATRLDPNVRPGLQLIVAGYSVGKPSVRYGEVYTIDWDTDSDGEISSEFATDQGLGVAIGGQRAPVDRFLRGADSTLAGLLIDGWEGTYNRTRDYVLAEVTRAGGRVPAALKDLPPPSPTDVPPWGWLSDFQIDPAKVPPYDRLLHNVAQAARGRAEPFWQFLSLPMAVNFVWHMLLLACADSTYFPRLPTVGSGLTIATVTRHGGFEEVWAGSATIRERV